MAAAPPDTLTLVRDFSVRVRSSDADIEGPDGQVTTVRLDGLFELLAAFEAPASTAAVLAALPAQGASDWAERAAILMALRKVGVLGAPSAADPIRGGFASPVSHAEMLHDRERVYAYARAIEEVVRPGDVVVDLGTGTGILAVLAAKAGAKHVYAIEESSIGEVARVVFAANGVADRVTLVAGHSTRITLPERGNVLVTETLGCDPLDEGILVYVEDARRRLLCEDARLIPQELDVVLVGVEVPLTRTPVLDEAAIATWREQFGVDLGPLLAMHPGGTCRLYDDAHVFATLPKVTEVARVEHIDLRTDAPATAEHRVVLRTTRAAAHAGVALGYDAQLAPSVRLRVGAQATELCPSWRYPIFTKLVATPLTVGDELVTNISRTRTSCKVTVE